MKSLITEYLENYFNKTEIGFRLPAEINLDNFWHELSSARRNRSENLPLKDQGGNSFWYTLPRCLQKDLHEIDSYGRDSLHSLVKKEIENELIKESLIEEGFYSSVIEGAFSTLKKARELANNHGQPKNNSEQMILNNFKAMRFILENKDQQLSNELVLELHRIITEKTMADRRHSGRYRDGPVYIVDGQGKTIYTPPPAAQIPEAMEKLLVWINADSEKSFIHPIIKASILHFYLAYLHPFFDGNGRTSRALFYFYLLKNNYDFFRYFSISAIINNSRGNYYRSIKDVEDYSSDLTYFLLYLAGTVLKAINEVKIRITEHYQKDHYLARISERRLVLNPRQNKFLKKFLLWEEKQISINKYQEMFGVVYQTARADLLDLAKKQLLKQAKSGRKFIFLLNSDF